MDRSIGSGLPVEDTDDVGATAEKAAALLTNDARMRAVLNFMVLYLVYKQDGSLVPSV